MKSIKTVLKSWKSIIFIPILLLILSGGSSLESWIAETAFATNPSKNLTAKSTNPSPVGPVYYIRHYDNKYYLHKGYPHPLEWVAYSQLDGDFSRIICINWETKGPGTNWYDQTQGVEISRIDQQCGKWLDMRCKVKYEYPAGQENTNTTNTIRLDTGACDAQMETDPLFGRGQVFGFCNL